MGKSLAAAFGEAAAVFDETSGVLSVDVRALLWESRAAECFGPLPQSGRSG
jgi:hypothetical protein